MIKATTIYDKRVNEELLKFNLINNPIRWIVYLLATISSILLLIFNLDSDFFLISLFILIFIVFFDLVFIYYYFISPKLKLRKFEDKDAVTNYVEFDNSLIRIKSRYNGKKESTTIPYEKIYKLCESQFAFYFFVDRYNTLIVTKDGIESSAEDLKLFLNEKITGKRNKLK